MTTYFCLELKEPSVREVEINSFSGSDAVMGLTRFELSSLLDQSPRYKFLSSRRLYTFEAKISGFAIVEK